MRFPWSVGTDCLVRKCTFYLFWCSSTLLLLSCPGIEPGPPTWEASTLEKSPPDSLLPVMAIRNFYIWARECRDTSLLSTARMKTSDCAAGSYSMPVNQLQYTCPETVRRVYALARSLSRILREAGLRYWTSGGTTLGILRYRFFRSGSAKRNISVR